MKHLPAQCDPLFRIIKLHFWEQYVNVFNNLRDTVVTEKNVDYFVKLYKDIVRPTVNLEPRGIPTMEEWIKATDDFHDRINEDIAQAIAEFESIQ